MANRTALFSRHQPGGVFTVQDVKDHPVNVWFVDSAAAGAGDTLGHGQNPDIPFATLGYAFSSDLVAAGDVVYVMPGHSQTLAAAITMDIAGVRVVGLGDGNKRPTFVGGAIDYITITADDVSAEGLVFTTPSAGGGVNINIAAARARVANCRFNQGANSVSAITVTAAGELPTLEDNEVFVAADGPQEWVLFEGVIDRPIVRRNVVVGSDGANAYDNGVLNFGALAITNPVVEGNFFDGADVALTCLANVGALVGDCVTGNFYAGSAVNGDTVGYLNATLAAGAITAAVIANDAIGATEIANGAIDAATFAAGAIDAAAIANGAIDAATFAAGAIDAAAIANGAIDAATFAAGAIDAAAIANGAIDAATFAAGAIDAAAIANAAIDAATFAAGAVDAAAIADAAVDLATYAADAKLFHNGFGAGTTAQKANVAASGGAGSINLFTVAGGRVMIHAILSEVTTVCQAAQCRVKIDFLSTATGTAFDLSTAGAGYDLNAAADGMLSGFTGVPADTMTLGSGCRATRPVVVDAGTIRQTTADAANTGRLQYDIYWSPITPGATVVAA